MKTLSTVLANAPTTSLKIVHSYTLASNGETLQPLRFINPALAKISPYKRLFVIHPLVQNAVNWDADWFNHYE
jgi:hypothetical protein